jgi:hypothetical protein
MDTEPILPREPTERAAEPAQSPNAGTWSVWVEAGSRLFADDRLPTLREAVRAAERVVVVAAADRFSSNISRIARHLGGLSRRRVRVVLANAGLYTPRQAPRSAGPPPPHSGSPSIPNPSATRL